MAEQASRGEVWLINLDPALGHEIGRRRPCVIVSADWLNHGPAGLAIVVPMTSVNKRIPFHIPIDPPEGGIRERSYIKSEDVRSIDTSRRLISQWGRLSESTMALIDDRLRIVMNL